MRRFLQSCLTELHILASEEQLDKLGKYMQLVLKTNEKLNLTAITDEKEFVIKHIADSLSAFAMIGGALRVIDVGAGAGFPSVPLSILCPASHFTILDATKKKMDFVQQALEDLDIQNAEVVCARAEELGRESHFREGFDAALARAVAPMPILAELCLPFVRVGGHFIAYKGAEEDTSKVAYAKLGGVLSEIVELTLPFSDYLRRLIVVKKETSTAKQYPRRYAQMKKQPI